MDKVKIEYCLFSKEDSCSFADCIREFYGDGYPSPQYLDGEYLNEACRKSSMYVICGKNAAGEIVSTSAVNYISDFAGSAILMLRVVKKAYRGLGIGGRQQEILLAAAGKNKNLHSLYADVMTHDTVSQTSLLHEGFVYTGIRLMLYYGSIMAPGLSCPEKTKLSQAVMCRRSRETGKRFLHCPVKHRAAVRKIYHNLGTECEFMEENAEGTAGLTELVIRRSRRHDMTEMIIRQAGRDFVRAAGQELDWMLQTGSRTGLCYLNMSCKGSMDIYAFLTDKGFFFTGIKPLNEDGEYMLLAYIGQQKTVYGEIRVAGEGQELLAYIRKQEEERTV